MSRYTIDELKVLRESPLVKKPEDLPSIEQWLEQTSQDQQPPSQPNQANQAGQVNQRKARNSNSTSTTPNGARDENKTPMGNFAQRPSLLQSRHTSRSSVNTSGMSLSDLSRVATNLVRTLQADGLLEDIVLGPPKTSFASSRNANKLSSESGDKLAATSEDANEDDAPPPATTATSARSRFFQDRAAAATSITTPAGSTSTRATSGLKSDSERWRGSKKTEDDDERNGDKERLHGRRDRNTDSQDEAGVRRNGYGARSDNRWSRDGEGSRPLAKLAEAQRGGWRDRERARQENHYGRDSHSNNNNNNGNERDPEWMDEPPAKEDSMPQMKTAEDFEKWKESMNKKKNPQPEDVAATPVRASAAKSIAPATPVVQDGGFNSLFGTWGQSAPTDSPVVEAAAAGAATPKTAKAPNTAKGKASRFASMFAPKDEPRDMEPSSPSVFKQSGNDNGNGSTEDKEGFARILAMLGKPSLGGDERDVSSPSQAGALGALFGAASQQQNRPPSFPQTPDDAVASFVTKKSSSTRPESGLGGIEAFMSPQPPQDKPVYFPGPRGSGTPSNVASPDPSRLRLDTASQPHQQQAPPAQFPFLDHAPSSSSQLRHMQQTPDGAPAQQKPKNALNKDSEFLLNLISQAANNRSAVQQNAQLGPQGQKGPQSYGQDRQQQQQAQQQRPDDFQLFLDQPSQQHHQQQQQLQQQQQQLQSQPQRRSTQSIETHAPKPQQPHRMPGQLEEQLFKSGIPQLMNLPASERERMDQPQPRGVQQRVPPGFYDDPAIMLQQHQQQIQQQMQQATRRVSQAPQNGIPQGQNQGQVPEHMFAGLPPGFTLGPQPQQQGQGREPGQVERGPANDRERLPQPPPGFNPNMRHPPGFAGIPGIFQPPQQQQQVGNPSQQGQPGQRREMRGAGNDVDFNGLSLGMASMQHGPPQGLPPGMQGPPPPGGPGPQGMPQGLPHIPGMGPPPPGFFNGMPPPPGFFNGLPPPPGFPGMGMPPPGHGPSGMISPPGLPGGMRGNVNGIGSPLEGPMGQGIRSPIEGQMHGMGLGMGLPLGFGLPSQGQQRRQ